MTLHYVPAGVETYSQMRAQLSVKTEPNEKETTDFGKKYKRWRTKDKTVSLTVSSHVSGISLKDSVDAIVPVFSASFVQACGLTKILANPIHRDFAKRPFKMRGIESIVDSGGFQMLRYAVKAAEGKPVGDATSFINPDDVIKRYNAEADVGMPLDLPVRSSVEPLFFDRVSQMIKANDDYILARLDPGVHLALISHGSTLKARAQRLDILDRKAEVVAIAGLNIKPAPGVDHILNNVENLMYVVHRYHKKTRYFHVLGVTSKLWMFIYALLDASKYVREIGGDSVSHRLSSLVGMYDLPNFKMLDLPRDQAYKTTPPCNCPVCGITDDIRIMQSSILLESHNMWVRAKQTELLSDLARNYLDGTITLKTVHTAMGLNIDLQKFHVVVRYVMEVVGSNKWRPIKSSHKVKSLFTGVKPATSKKGTLKLAEEYDKILKRYEKFHGRSFK